MAWFGEINFTSLRNMSPFPLVLKNYKAGAESFERCQVRWCHRENARCFRNDNGKAPLYSDLWVTSCGQLFFFFPFSNLNPLIVLLPHWQLSDTQSSNWRSSRVPCSLVLLSLLLLPLLFLFYLPLLPPPRLLSPSPSPTHTSHSTNSDSVSVMYIPLDLNIFLWICFSPSRCLQS